MTKISIITPSYNHAEFIERTIFSVISQKGDFEIEYIIMDGGSTDSTKSILEKIDKEIKDGVIKIHCQNINFIRTTEKDKGQSNAINKGLKLATGDIITYLNSDDTYAPDALSIVIKELHSSDKERCYGKCKIIDRHDKEIRKRITFYKDILGEKYSYKKLLTENFIAQMTVFWTKKAMKTIGFFNEEEHLCMDYEYWVRLGEHYDPIYIPYHIANFRFYQNSKSGSRFEQQFEDELRIAKKYARGKYQGAILMHYINYYKITRIYKILNILKK